MLICSLFGRCLHCKHRPNFLWPIKGFSLIQLVMIMVIIGVLSAILVGYWPGKVALLRAQAEQITQSLRYARHYAIAQEISTKVTFTTGSALYTLTDINDTAIRWPTYTTNNITYDPDFTVTLQNLPNSYIIFDKDGQPYQAASTPLASNATLALSHAGKTGTLTIYIGSGMITTPSWN